MRRPGQAEEPGVLATRLLAATYCSGLKSFAAGSPSALAAPESGAIKQGSHPAPAVLDGPRRSGDRPGPPPHPMPL